MLIFKTENDINNFFKGIYRRIVDLIDYIKGDKAVRDFIKKVPRYCRWDCHYIFMCRSQKKNWKCKKGCIKIS